MHVQVVKTIVATEDIRDWDRCVAILQAEADLKIVAHAPGLMELFSLVERDPPQLVLISARLARLPEFDLMVTLFREFDVRWLSFERSMPAPQREQRPSLRTSGLFSLPIDGNPRMVVDQIRSVLRARHSVAPAPELRAIASKRRYRRLVLIGASTGGIDALRTVLGHFGSDCPPTVIVQHISEGFGRNLASTLSRGCAAKVLSFEPDLELGSGMVCIVAGLSHHVVLAPSYRPVLTASHEPAMSGHRPSIDRIFLSAVPFAPRIVAAVMTGMGRDGAEGLLALRRAGAQTLAQDEASSVVYGMPGAAWANGGATQQVALRALGPTLLAEAQR